MIDQLTDQPKINLQLFFLSAQWQYFWTNVSTSSHNILIITLDFGSKLDT